MIWRLNKFYYSIIYENIKIKKVERITQISWVINNHYLMTEIIVSYK